MNESRNERKNESVPFKIGAFFMINLCLVVIATQFAETKRRETERMMQERKRLRSTGSICKLFFYFKYVITTLIIDLSVFYTYIHGKLAFSPCSLHRHRVHSSNLWHLCTEWGVNIIKWYQIHRIQIGRSGR